MATIGGSISARPNENVFGSIQKIVSVNQSTTTLVPFITGSGKKTSYCFGSFSQTLSHRIDSHSFRQFATNSDFTVGLSYITGTSFKRIVGEGNITHSDSFISGESFHGFFGSGNITHSDSFINGESKRKVVASGIILSKPIIIPNATSVQDRVGIGNITSPTLIFDSSGKKTSFSYGYIQQNIQSFIKSVSFKKIEGTGNITSFAPYISAVGGKISIASWSENIALQPIINSQSLKNIKTYSDLVSPIILLDGSGGRVRVARGDLYQNINLVQTSSSFKNIKTSSDLSIDPQTVDGIAGRINIATWNHSENINPIIASDSKRTLQSFGELLFTGFNTDSTLKVIHKANSFFKDIFSIVFNSETKTGKTGSGDLSFLQPTVDSSVGKRHTGYWFLEQNIEPLFSSKTTKEYCVNSDLQNSDVNVDSEGIKTVKSSSIITVDSTPLLSSFVFKQHDCDGFVFFEDILIDGISERMFTLYEDFSGNIITGIEGSLYRSSTGSGELVFNNFQTQNSASHGRFTNIDLITEDPLIVAGGHKMAIYEEFLVPEVLISFGTDNKIVYDPQRLRIDFYIKNILVVSIGFSLPTTVFYTNGIMEMNGYLRNEPFDLYEQNMPFIFDTNLQAWRIATYPDGKTKMIVHQNGDVQCLQTVELGEVVEADEDMPYNGFDYLLHLSETGVLKVENAIEHNRIYSDIPVDLLHNFEGTSHRYKQVSPYFDYNNYSVIGEGTVTHIGSGETLVLEQTIGSRAKNSIDTDYQYYRVVQIERGKKNQTIILEGLEKPNDR